jgi:hypothetical protein
VAFDPRRQTRPSPKRGRRAVAAFLAGVGLLLGVVACGMDVQTTRPYTPAEGVNANVGDPPVEVRNLMILSREPGQGFLSASLSATERDSLVSVSGRPYKTDGAVGTALTVTQPDPIAINPGGLIVLTERPLIDLSSPDLEVGGDAELTLMFSTAGSLTIRVPVVDANQPAYATITPSPSATARS